jgi:5-methyltetrahydropteroyltriglutamate--homocysteine methyltransferase
MPARYRADHVGSLLRPPDLLEARRAGPGAAPVRAAEDHHIRHVLRRQKELGLDVFTDGELRRRNFMSDFTDAVDGFDMGEEVARSWQAGTARPVGVSRVAGVVTRRLRAVRPLTGHELPFLKAHSPGPIKMTLPSATQFPAIDFKRPPLEDPDALARRIEEAARYVPLENLALSPQCGFASTMEGNLMTEDEQWAKLRLVAETARRVWH